MEDFKSPLTATEEESELATARPAHPQWPGAVMVAGGLLLILGAPTLIWLFRAELADLSPRALMTLRYGAGGLALLYLTAGHRYGAGGLALLYLTAGLPLGAILLAAGGTRLYSAERAGRVLLPLLGIELVYFAFHAIRLMLDLSIPFLLSALVGGLVVLLFLALVWIWARKRPRLGPHRRRVADLQLGAGLCFFSAAWQACGLAGAPGFALYPELVQKLANQSFIAAQALAVQVFIALGFVFLLLAMRAEPVRGSE